MSKKFVQTPAVTLYQGLSASGTSMVITPYPVDIQTGTKLTFADFGDNPTLTVDPKISGYEEIIEFSSMVDNGNNTATLAIAGRNLIGQSPYTTTGTGKTHGASAVVVFSDNPQMYNAFFQTANVDTDSTLAANSDTKVSSQKAIKTYITNVITAITGTATNLLFGTVKLSVAAAVPATPIAVGDNDTRVPPINTSTMTANQVAALVGTGTPNGTTGKYVTNDDTSTSGASGKVVRLNGTSYPAADGTAITGIAVKKESYTASGAISQNDTLYVSAANTVKSLYPSAMTTAASITTGASHIANMVFMPLSTNGTYLSFSGGSMATSGVLYAQVRTINAGETDFANGSETVIYNTGNGTRGYSIAPIGSDSFVVIFQADTGGAAAGIKVVYVTVSGTTVSVGSPTIIETTGSLSYKPSIAKVDTNKVIIFYKKDSDNKLYSQVITLPGGVITTSTPVVVDNTNTNPIISVAEQLATGSVIVLYNFNNTIVYGNTITVSGTVPTIAAQQSILTIASANTWYMSVKAISSTKLFFAYSTAGSSTNDTCKLLTVSGATITGGSTLALASARLTETFPIVTIGTKYLLVSDFKSATAYTVFLLDVSGATPTSVTSQDCSQSTTSSAVVNIAMVKVSPWTYTVAGYAANDDDYIFKLTPASSARIGTAEADIADTATGNVLYRYLPQTLSGITLTAGSLYYTDDTGQPTVNSSLTSPTLGVAISTSKILIQ